MKISPKSNVDSPQPVQTFRSMDITSLIVEAISGAVGGNVAGAAMKDKSLGTVGNSIRELLEAALGARSSKP